MAVINEVNRLYERPWGTYITTYVEEREEHGKRVRTLEEKDIVVNPGGRLSIQSHEKRAEKWTIISGYPEILVIEREPDDCIDLTTIEQHFQPYQPGDIIYIQQHWIHAIRNLTDEPVKFHEVQTGICEESDIIRYQDIYGRVG